MLDKSFQEGEEFAALRDELSELLAQTTKIKGNDPLKLSIKYRANELFLRYQQLEKIHDDDVSREDRIEIISNYAQIIRSTSNIPFTPTIEQELHYRANINHNHSRETSASDPETQKSIWSLP